MMSSNVAAAEGGGYPEQPAENWWLPKWSSWLATIGSLVLAFFATLAIVFNIIPPSPTNIFAGILQFAAAIAILAIEGPTVVAFLTFAKPIGLFFEGRSLYFKTAVYAGLTIIPMLLGTDSLPVYFGFIVSAAIVFMHGAILIGRKGSLDDMRAAAEQPKI